MTSEENSIENIPEEVLNKIRQQESNKLHSTIKNLKSENEKLKERAEETMPDNKTYDDILNEISSLKSQLTSADSKSEENEIQSRLDSFESKLGDFIESSKTDDQKQMEERFNAIQKELENKTKNLSEAQKNLQENNSRLMRLQAIRDFGKPVVEELVGGNTEEEIQNSLQKARDTYVKYFGDDESKETETPQQQPNPEESESTATQPPAEESTPMKQNLGPGTEFHTAPSQTLNNHMQKLNELPQSAKIKYWNENKDEIIPLMQKQNINLSGELQ